MARRALATLALLGLPGCFQPTSTGSGISDSPTQACQSCKGTGDTRGGSGSGSATSGQSGPSGGSAGSTGGGTVGGSTGGAAVSGGSSGGAVDAGILQCPSGTLYVVTGLIDVDSPALAGMPAVGALVTEVGEDQVPLQGVGTSATSDANGNAQLCFAFDQPVTLSVQASQTPTTYLEELVATPAAVDAGFAAIFKEGLPLFQDDLLIALGAVVPGGIQYTGAFVIAVVLSSSQTACPSEAGWTFDLVLPDGGTLPDGGNDVPFGIAYFNSEGVPALGMTATSIRGSAILYNIDPTLTNGAILTATNPDAGACPLVQGAVQTTGYVALGNSTFTYAPLFTP
jgi:hypothetical protein